MARPYRRRAQRGSGRIRPMAKVMSGNYFEDFTIGQQLGTRPRAR
jgi:hypothetical protein